MGIQSQIYKMLGLLFVFASQSAYADSPLSTMHFVGRYDFSWSGIGLAAAELSIDKTKDDYKLRVVIVSKGIVNLFTRHRSDTTASGTYSGSIYQPRLYESHYWTKDKPRHVKLAFDNSGKITQEINEPPENRADRPEVPHSLKDGTMDPLTLVLAIPLGNNAPRVFDAKRLWQASAVKEEPVMLRAYDGRRTAIPYSLTRKPLSGMTAKELVQFQRGESPLSLYYSADERHIPLYMSLPIYLGNLQGSLTKECATWDECRVN